MGNCEKIARRVLIVPSDCDLSALQPDAMTTDETHFSGSFIPLRIKDTFQRVVPLLFCSVDKELIDRTLSSKSLNTTKEYFVPPEGKYAFDKVILFNSVEVRVLKFRFIEKKEDKDNRRLGKELEELAGLIERLNPGYVMVYGIGENGDHPQYQTLKESIGALFRAKHIMFPWELMAIDRHLVQVDSDCFEEEILHLPRDNFDVSQHPASRFEFSYKLSVSGKDRSVQTIAEAEGTAPDLEGLESSLVYPVWEEKEKVGVLLEVRVGSISPNFTLEYLRESPTLKGMLKLFGVDSYEIKVIGK